LVADISNDGLINSKDLTFLAQSWMMRENQQPGDLDRNGIVNSTDLSQLTNDWLKYVKPPVVNIIKPQNNDVLTMQPANIEIEATAESVIGTIVKVEFFIDDKKIGDDNDGSDGWAANFIQKQGGTYNLKATAIDSRGITATSSIVEITINPPL